MDNLDRFVIAQDAIYTQVIRELAAGRKTGHWMWYIFPQVSVLGYSETTKFYAIATGDEAKHYLVHPILGPRLRECVALVLANSTSSIVEIFGSVDALKFRSSMTLFAKVATDTIFLDALTKFCDGRPDEKTIELLNSLSG